MFKEKKSVLFHRERKILNSRSGIDWIVEVNKLIWQQRMFYRDKKTVLQLTSSNLNLETKTELVLRNHGGEGTFNYN